MLSFDPARIMRLRNIEKPFAFLRANGFGHHTAHLLIAGRISAVKVGHIQRLCHLLRCTPNDLFSYQPDKDAPEPTADILGTLIRKPCSTAPLSTIFQELPIERLEAIRQELTDRIDPPHAAAL